MVKLKIAFTHYGIDLIIFKISKDKLITSEKLLQIINSMIGELMKILCIS